MRRWTAFIAFAGLAAFTLAGLALRDRFAELPPDEPGQPVAGPSGTAATNAAPSVVALPVPTMVRPVAPEIVAAPPVDYGTLERVEARNPLSEIGAARSPREGPPKETILFRPLATGGGSFASLGYQVDLAGIAPTEARETCVSDGISWPCGIHARTAFRNWLRGRALSCVVPPMPTAEKIVTDCRLGKQDPAAWLVAYGWARALPDSPYVEAGDTARAERRGLFGPAPAVPDAAAAVPSATTAIVEPAPDGSDPAPFVSEPLADGAGASGG